MLWLSIEKWTAAKFGEVDCLEKSGLRKWTAQASYLEKSGLRKWTAQGFTWKKVDCESGLRSDLPGKSGLRWDRILHPKVDCGRQKWTAESGLRLKVDCDKSGLRLKKWTATKVDCA